MLHLGWVSRVLLYRLPELGSFAFSITFLVNETVGSCVVWSRVSVINWWQATDSSANWHDKVTFSLLFLFFYLRCFSLAFFNYECDVLIAIFGWNFARNHFLWSAPKWKLWFFIFRKRLKAFVYPLAPEIVGTLCHRILAFILTHHFVWRVEPRRLLWCLYSSSCSSLHCVGLLVLLLKVKVGEYWTAEFLALVPLRLYLAKVLVAHPLIVVVTIRWNILSSFHHISQDQINRLFKIIFINIF